jgi:hypothetical protein
MILLQRKNQYTEWPKKMYTLFTHQYKDAVCIHFLGHSVYSYSDHLVHYGGIVAREWEIDPLGDDNHDDDILSNDLEVGNRERHSLAVSFFPTE